MLVIGVCVATGHSWFTVLKSKYLKISNQIINNAFMEEKSVSVLFETLSTYNI